MASLTIDALGMAFGRASDGATVLSTPQLTVTPGALVTVAGPSGSGKSTFLHLIGGVLRPTAGRILWDGDDLTAMGESRRDGWRRRHVGFLFQNFHLIEELTALENVLLPAYFSAWSARPLRRRAEELLVRFGVPAERRAVATLSRGEMQRVGLARALLFDPPVILADEPTASLDRMNGAAVATTLAALADEGRTVIVATHDRDLLDVSGRRLVIERGLVEDEDRSR